MRKTSKVEEGVDARPRKPNTQAPQKRKENPKPISEERRKRLQEKFAREAAGRAGPVTKRKGRVRYRSGRASRSFKPGKGRWS
jgi:hypothetical protein